MPAWPSEAEVSTPPRGIQGAPAGARPQHPTPPAQTPQPPFPPHQHSPVAAVGTARGQRIRTVATVAVLLAALGLAAWISTSFYRTNWSLNAPRNPIAVAEDGSATHEGITISVVDVQDLGSNPEVDGSEWVGPEGTHVWRVDVAVDSTNPDIATCYLDLVDSEGRTHRSGTNAPRSSEFAWAVWCGEDPELAPTQAVAVLVPADVEVVAVRLTDFSLNPDYFMFELD